MSDVFEALATPARRAILDELHDRDGQTLFELCARVVMKDGLGPTRPGASSAPRPTGAAGHFGRAACPRRTDAVRALRPVGDEAWLGPDPSGDLAAPRRARI